MADDVLELIDTKAIRSLRVVDNGDGSYSLRVVAALPSGSAVINIPLDTQPGTIYNQIGDGAGGLTALTVANSATEPAANNTHNTGFSGGGSPGNTGCFVDVRTHKKAKVQISVLGGNQILDGLRTFAYKRTGPNASIGNAVNVSDTVASRNDLRAAVSVTVPQRVTLELTTGMWELQFAAWTNAAGKTATIGVTVEYVD